MQLAAPSPRRRGRVAAARLTALAGAIALLGASTASADDAVEFTTTWFQEQRQGGLGGLTVVHPQLDVGIAGEVVEVDLGYAADAVSGATATVYSSDAVSSATTFSDLRHEGRFGLGFVGKRAQFGASAMVGVERDYVSIVAGAGGSIDLPGKNTNVALTYSHNFDEVCDKDNAMLGIFERRALTGFDPCAKDYVLGTDTPGVTVWRDVSIDTAQGTVTQNLSPTMNMQLAIYGQVIDGFQSNPYRRVRVGENEPQENIPTVRARLALSARLNRFFPALRGALQVNGRYYSDTWGVNSGTGELAWSQYAGSSLLVRLRTRIYQQSAATFFKDAFFYETESAAGEYFTGDRELAPVRNVLVGGKLTIITVAEDDKDVWGLFDKVQVNLKADMLFLSELAADDPEANLAGRDRQFLSADQLIDSFILQFGVLASY